VSTAETMTTPRISTYFHVHLVSDSTGETLNAMARAVCARFENVLPIEHIYALVRSPGSWSGPSPTSKPPRGGHPHHS